MSNNYQNLDLITSAVKLMMEQFTHDIPRGIADYWAENPQRLSENLKNELSLTPLGHIENSKEINLVLCIIHSLLDDLSVEDLQEIINNPQRFGKALRNTLIPDENTFACRAMNEPGPLSLIGKIHIPRNRRPQRWNFFQNASNNPNHGIRMEIVDKWRVLYSDYMRRESNPSIIKSTLEIYAINKTDFLDCAFKKVPEYGGPVQRQNWIEPAQLEYLIRRQPNGESGVLSTSYDNYFRVRTDEIEISPTRCSWRPHSKQWRVEFYKNDNCVIFEGCQKGSRIGVHQLSDEPV